MRASRKHKFLTKAILAKLPPLYSQDGKGEDAIAYVKFFTPWSNWQWFGSEYDPVERQFFGKVVGLDTDLGYFDLDELDALTKTIGGCELPAVERDCHFNPTPLKNCG